MQWTPVPLDERPERGSVTFPVTCKKIFVTGIHEAVSGPHFPLLIQRGGGPDYFGKMPVDLTLRAAIICRVFSLGEFS